MSAVPEAKPRNERLFSVYQVARRLALNEHTVRRHIRSGELPAVRNRMLPGQPYMVAESDMEAFRARRFPRS
jgi:excisionase family DNA binding protein